MKWHEMSVLEKIAFVITSLSVLGTLVVIQCTVFGVLPDFYETPLFSASVGTSWLGLGILNWKKQRTWAIFNLVIALLSYVAILFRFVF